MAKLNEMYYQGKDQYSDGDVEADILALVKQGITIDGAGGEDIPYPVLYHLSKVRENIFLWYPFREHARILEVGAGCGAVTGVLCEKAEEVVAVELSHRRASINYERNRSRKNLEIIVGNLNDIPVHAEFDYIILNGVLEYAGSFTPGEQPYEDFLKGIARRLRPGGTILIAIENRLGAKYFAGAPEDHTDRYFLGLDQYHGVKTVKTFTKEELKELCVSAGLICSRFYYPYPDYKFPYEIFTDETVNTPLYGRPMFQFQEGRMALFYEAGLCQTLAKEGVAGTFANSFLVEATKEHVRPTREIQYVKLNTDRNPGFRIYTEIWEEQGKKYVGKYPADAGATEHLLRMNRVRAEEHSGWSYVTGEEKDGAVIYDYLKEATLDDMVSVLLTKREGRRVEELVDDFYRVFLSSAQESEEYHGEQFAEVFGPRRCPGKKKCCKNLDIDLIFDNIFCRNGAYEVIDTEWVFPFEVPVEYVMWRVLNELFYKHPGLSQIVSHQELGEKYGITPEDAEVFKEWEIHFAYQYVGSYGLQKYEKEPLRPEMEKIALYYGRERSLSGKLYINTGNGYNEDETVTVKVPLREGHFSMKMALPQGIKVMNLRWDPGDYPCRCKVETITGSGRKLVCIPQNHASSQEGEELFLTPDPNYEITGRLGRVSEIVVEGSFHYLRWEELMKELEILSTLKPEEPEESVESNPSLARRAWGKLRIGK
ncbi:MAG: class I SAM-dependent methyltransferase [Lachnospiraceae bacterium]|nr:class I SAM-dependent methyltransferase [Lachnospiraceae bacterium]